MTSFPRLTILAIISRVYTLKSVDAFTFASSSTTRESSTRATAISPLQQISINNNNNNPVHESQRQRSGLSSKTSLLMADKKSGNPFQTFLGDVATSIIGGGGGNSDTMNEELDNRLNQISTLSSWDDIRTNLESKQTQEEKSFRSNVEKGIGRASPLNKIRLFDESNKEEDIRVVFYRDSASWCPCKLFIQLSLLLFLWIIHRSCIL